MFKKILLLVYMAVSVKISSFFFRTMSSIGGVGGGAGVLNLQNVSLKSVFGFKNREK